MRPENADGTDASRSPLAGLKAAAEQHRNAPKWLWWLLEATLRDHQRLAAVAGRSVHHENGFVKIVPGSDGHPRLRLHVWPAGGGEPSGINHPHGHRWPFASWVITGSLRETTLVESNRGEPFGAYAYPGSALPIPAQPVRRVLLAPDVSTMRTAGEVYTRSTGELHVAIPADDGLVATLVLQGTNQVETAPVFRRPGAPPPREGQPVSAVELRALLTEVTGVLQPVA